MKANLCHCSSSSRSLRPASRRCCQSGGIFASLPAASALVLRRTVGSARHQHHPAAILGMAGYFAGVVQAPMTAFVITSFGKNTGDHQGGDPIMAASMIGYVTSRILSREPLYHGLSRVFIAAAIRDARARRKKEPKSTRT